MRPCISQHRIIPCQTDGDLMFKPLKKTMLVSNQSQVDPGILDGWLTGANEQEAQEAKPHACACAPRIPSTRTSHPHARLATE